MNVQRSVSCRLASFFAAAICVSAPVSAEDYESAAMAACEQLQRCARTKLDDVPPEYRAMAEQGLAAMCEQLPKVNEATGFGPQHPLYDQATRCMRSIARTSCEAMDAGETTPECEELDRASDNY